MMIVLICSNLDKLLAIYIIIVIKKKLLRQKRAVQIISEIISYNSRIFCTLVHIYVCIIHLQLVHELHRSQTDQFHRDKLFVFLKY